MNEKEYLEGRVDTEIQWYDTKSVRHKRWFLSLKVMETIFALSIPFLSAYVTTEGLFLKVVLGLFGLIVALIANLIALYKFQENWIQYRTVAELLKHEKYLFMARSGPYGNTDTFKIFVERFENLVSKEVNTWASHTKERKGSQESVPLTS